MDGELAIQHDSLALHDVSVHPVPYCPVDASRQSGGMELDADIKVFYAALHDTPELTPRRGVIMKAGPVFECSGLARRQRPGQQDIDSVDILSGLVEGSHETVAALADFYCQGVGVGPVRVAVKPVHDRLDNMNRTVLVRLPVGPEIMMIVQRERPVPRRTQLGRGLRAHGARTGEHADPAGSLPQLPQALPLLLWKAKSIDEQRQSRPAEQLTRERAENRVLQLARHRVGVSRRARMIAQMAGEHLGDGKLIDLA